MKDVFSSNLASLLILTSLLVTLLITPWHAEATTKCDQDCLYLLTILDRVLEDLLTNNPRGSMLISYMKRACVHPSLRELHYTIYSTLDSYYNLIIHYALATDQELPVSTISDLHRSLQKLSEYARRLQGCSHDKEASKALVVGVELKARRLIEGLAKLASTPQLRLNFTMYPEKAVYEPGEELVLLLHGHGLEKEILEPVLLVLPSMHSLSISYEIITGDGSVLIKLKLPGAYEAEKLCPTYSLVQEGLHFLLTLRASEEYYAVKLIKIKYYQPAVLVSVPATIRRGTVLQIQIQADNYYNASITLNDQLVSNNEELVLIPGVTIIEIPTTREPARLGLNKLKLCVNATLKTVSQCYEYPFFIEPNIPNVDIYVPSLVTTWAGRFSVALNTGKESDLVFMLSSPYDRITSRLVNNTYVIINAGWLPVQKLNINVTIYDPHGEHDVLVLTFNTLVVNLPLLFIYSATIAVIPALLSKHEKAFATVLIKGLKGASAPLSTLREAVNYLGPYTSISSKVLQLYYKVLKKLDIPPPIPSETLREHYMSSIYFSQIAKVVKTLLWKLLLIAEKELYARKKPSLEEAVALYEEVVDASAE